MSFDEIFERFGGPAKVASIIGKSTPHVAAMRRRRSIPVRYWPLLIEASRKAEITINEAELLAAHVTSSDSAADVR